MSLSHRRNKRRMARKLSTWNKMFISWEKKKIIANGGSWRLASTLSKANDWFSHSKCFFVPDKKFSSVTMRWTWSCSLLFVVCLLSFKTFSYLLNQTSEFHETLPVLFLSPTNSFRRWLCDGPDRVVCRCWRLKPSHIFWTRPQKFMKLYQCYFYVNGSLCTNFQKNSLTFTTLCLLFL